MARTGNGKKYQIVWIFDDIDRAFTWGLLCDITEQWESGKTIEEIAKKYRRDPDEIFLALFHMARQGKVTRPFGILNNSNAIRKAE